MSMSENDFELLESYLDDELTSIEMGDLRRRLADEPELESLLSELRISREARADVWTSFEPGDKSVDLLVRNVRREVNRSLLTQRYTRGVRIFGSVAACIAMGFAGGYLMRGTPAASPVVPVADNRSDTSLATNDTSDQPPGNIVWNTNTAPSAGRDPNGYLVSFTDIQGNLIGSQRFKTLNEAREFMRDFQLRQQQQKQLQNNGVKMVADQF